MRHDFFSQTLLILYFGKSGSDVIMGRSSNWNCAMWIKSRNLSRDREMSRRFEGGTRGPLCLCEGIATRGKQDEEHAENERPQSFLLGQLGVAVRMPVHDPFDHAH